MRVVLLSVASLCLIWGCKDWDYPQEFPIVFTEEVVDINSEGAKMSGSIESLGSGQNFIAYGFVWSEQEMPTLNSSRLLIAGDVHEGEFSKIVNFDLINGTVYYVRAFIQSTEFVVYGNQVAFTSQGSLPPAIVDFAPKEGFDGTEIAISGQNFSARSEGNIVKIGELLCEVVLATDSLLKIKLPSTDLVGDYKVSIEVAGKTTVSDGIFTILGPRIRSISKSSGRVGDLLTIEGEYFDQEGYAQIYFGTPEQWVSNHSTPYVVSSTQMECYLPDYPYAVGKIELHASINNIPKRFVLPGNFTILNSWEKISDTTPLEPYREAVRYGSAVIGNSIFAVGGKELYEFNTITKTWTKRQDFPGSYRFSGTCFSYEGKLFYGFGEGYWPAPSCCGKWENFNDLWQYDPGTDSWVFLLNAPFEPRSRMIQFVIGNTAYMGFGGAVGATTTEFSDFWSFNIETSTWNQIPVPASVNTSFFHSTSFSVNEKGYIIGLEEYMDMWEFDPITSSWTQKADYPDDIHGENTTRINNHGLVLSSAVNTGRSRVYEYDPIKDRWIKRQSMGGTTGAIQFAHYVNGVLYYASGNVWGLTFN
jgi:N-acetylneuraminic acid mutarotase